MAKTLSGDDVRFYLVAFDVDDEQHIHEELLPFDVAVAVAQCLRKDGYEAWVLGSGLEPGYVYEEAFKEDGDDCRLVGTELDRIVLADATAQAFGDATASRLREQIKASRPTLAEHALVEA